MSRPKLKFDNLKILIIENHALMRNLLGQILVGFGANMNNIRECRDVPQALTELYSEHYDVIILDFFLGDLDGGDLAKKIRGDEECLNRQTPILLVTGMPDHHKITKVRDAGVNEILAKPIVPKDLYWRLYSMLAFPRPFIISKNYIGPGQRSHNPSSIAPYEYSLDIPLIENKKRAAIFHPEDEALFM